MDEATVIDEDFGSVICGRKYVKSFKIENNSKTIQTYTIESKGRKVANAGHDRLKIHPSQTTVLPGQSTNFTLTYLSYIENVTDNISYDVIRSDGKPAASLLVHAHTVGPIMNSSTIKVKFLCTRDAAETVKHIELLNTSNCKARFCFDIDEDNQLLEISQRSGILPSGVKLNIKVTFRPKEPGIYYKQIYCLIQFHKPIILNVLGVYSPKKRFPTKILNFKYPSEQNIHNTYETYMNKPDAAKMLEEKTTFLQKLAREYDIRLSDYQLKNTEEPDQNCSPPSKGKATTLTSQDVILSTGFVDVKNMSEVANATTLANSSKVRQYYYRWDHDCKNHFQVEPCRGIIKPSKRVDFSIYFTPSIPDQIYHVEVDLRIFPCNDENDENHEALDNCIDLPLTMSLKIIGHSFPDDSDGWIPQCSAVPKSLQLPSCAPGEIAYGTFLIERRGHLPVTFTTHLSINTNYTVQPPVGCITGNFQILVVRFNGNAETGAYEEELKITYNYSTYNCDCVQLRTFVEKPVLIFAEQNSYSFECTFPGSRTAAVIPIENPTNLHLRYRIKIPEDVSWLEISEAEGHIEPMSFARVKMIFRPEVPCEYLDYIECNISSTSYPQDVETEYVQLMGSSQFGYIVATPNMHDFGECIYGVEKSIVIHLFNFSPVILHFYLYATHRAFPVGNVDQDVKIKNPRGSISGKGSLDVEVCILPNDKDIFQYCIMCQILENDSENALPCEEPKKIFSFRFEGVMPCVKIIDLNINGGGPLFSPHWLWKMMSIDRVNQVFESVALEEVIDLKLPEAMINTPPIIITLLLEAKKSAEVSWHMEKEVLCSCRNSKDGMGNLKNCLHSKAMNIVPVKAKLPPKSKMIVQIILSYEVVEDCVFRWTLNIPYNRKILLNATVVSLPNEDVSFASMYLHPEVDLKPIFIGDIHPPLQLFWLYNNTNQSVSYIVDKVTLREATSVHRVFDCLNPNGSIPPFSSVPLAFLFKPNELILYSADVILCLRENVFTTIHLKGAGIASSQQIPEFSMERTIPEKSILRDSNACLKCNINFINIFYVREFSEIKRVFFLQNTSITDSWAFHWNCFQVQNFLAAEVFPDQGVIEPGEKRIMTLVLRTFGHSSFVSFSIPCDVVNYSSLKAHETALRFQSMTNEKAKDYFTITEKGISYEIPEILIPEKPKPSHIFITINTNIISCMNMDQKLLLQQQIILKSGQGIKQNLKLASPIKTSSLPCIQNSLEKVLWNIINSKVFKEKIRKLQKSLDYNYLQILSTNKEDSFKNYEGILLFNKNCVQKIVEDMLRNVIIKNCSK